jgi:predicted DCC family thiol-disulfide oxidoreductase YuxK
MQAVQKQKVFLVYDHDCPVCRGYCTRLSPRDDRTEIALVNARTDDSLMPEITDRGLDIDEGMVLKVGDDIFYGSEAAWRLTEYTRRRGFTGWIDRLFFPTRRAAQVMYPLGKAIRGAILRLLHIPRINNLKPENALKHQLGAAWARLRPGIQQRFGREPQAGEVFVYDGSMQIIRRSSMGWLFAQLTRVIGNPLTPYAGEDVPMQVRLYAKDGGVCWERLYQYAGRAPVVVSSVKRESTKGELLEVVGGGFGMKLHVFTDNGQLYFQSYRYFCSFLGWQIPLPHLLTPGVTHVVHLDHGDGSFTFRLSIRHPYLGETFFQEGVFRRAFDKSPPAA